VHVLHEGGGVHYGLFPGAPPRPSASRAGGGAGASGSLWVVLRPHNWRPETAEEHLLELDAETGAELSRARLPSHFTHDAARRGGRAYVASTGDGTILEFALPPPAGGNASAAAAAAGAAPPAPAPAPAPLLAPLRTIRLFTADDHPNTVAPLSDTDLWVVLHKGGQARAPPARQPCDRHRGREARSVPPPPPPACVMPSPSAPEPLPDSPETRIPLARRATSCGSTCRPIRRSRRRASSASATARTASPSGAARC